MTWINYPIEDSTKSPCIDTGDPASPLDSDSSRADMGALPFDRRLVGINDQDIRIPVDYVLLSCYPNPFNSSAVISYRLASPAPVTLEIFDPLGRLVEVLACGNQMAGYHQVIWKPERTSSGIYFVRLQTDKSNYSLKMLLVR